MKKLLLFLMTFGLVFLAINIDVNASESELEGWEYYEESPFTVPPNSGDDGAMYFEQRKDGQDLYFEGYWDFVIPFELTYSAILQEVKIDVIDNWLIGLYLNEYAFDIHDDWYDADAYNHFSEMDVTCIMKLYDEVHYTNVDISDYVYELLTTGIVIENIPLYTDERIYRIDFEFQIDYDFYLTDLSYNYDNISNIRRQYQIEIYYNSRVYSDDYYDGYSDGYDAGLDDGYDEGFDAGRIYGYDEGFEDGLNPETSGFSSILSALWVALSGFLGIKLFWNISIGAIILIPVVFGIISFIIGRKKD